MCGQCFTVCFEYFRVFYVLIYVVIQPSCLLNPIKVTSGPSSNNDLSLVSDLSPSSSILCCCLHLPPAVFETAIPFSFSRSLFHVFFGRPLFLWPCRVHCNAIIVFSQCMCPSQFHSLLLSWVSMDSWPVCLHNSLLVPTYSDHPPLCVCVCDSVIHCVRTMKPKRLKVKSSNLAQG